MWLPGIPRHRLLGKCYVKSIPVPPQMRLSTFELHYCVNMYEGVKAYIEYSLGWLPRRDLI